MCDYASWIANKIERPMRLLHTLEHSYVPQVSDLSGTIGLGSQENLLQELMVAEQNHRQLRIKKGDGFV